MKNKRESEETDSNSLTGSAGQEGPGKRDRTRGVTRSKAPAPFQGMKLSVAEIRTIVFPHSLSRRSDSKNFGGGRTARHLSPR